MVVDFSPDFSICVALARPPAVLVSPVDGSERGKIFCLPTAHGEHGKRQSQAAGSIICYKAVWHPGCHQLQPSLRIKGNEKDFTCKPSPAGEDGLWMHFERKENEESIMLKICMWEKGKREVTVKQNTLKNLLLPAKMCYQNVN